MAYPFNANQFYNQPSTAFRSRKAATAPAFGQQAYGPPYNAMPAYGAPPAQPLTRPLSRPLNQSLARPLNQPLTPLPALPLPAQLLNRPSPVLPAAANAAFAPFGSPALGNASPASPMPRPQVQNHFYALPAVKDPASTKKNIKKFLLITSAVVTGVFATAGTVVGLMWMFYPGFVELARSIGPKGASKAARAIKEWKKPGPILQRAKNAHQVYTQPVDASGSSTSQSGWQRFKNWFKSAETLQNEAKAAKVASQKAAEKAAEAAREGGNGFAEIWQTFAEKDTQAAKELGKAMGLDLERMTSPQYLAEVINRISPQQMEVILSKAMSGEPLDYGKILGDAINNISPEKLKGFLNVLFPQKLSAALAKSRETGNVSELLDKLWAMVSEEQKANIFNEGSAIGKNAIHEYAQTLPLVGRFLKMFQKPSSELSGTAPASVGEFFDAVSEQNWYSPEILRK
ncbi:hypothetical protein [Vampirovibrio sp.]|uniref:hypothetical protein n=1 Tax=Vampirovibrio sp. TaxID=2717857 RepID=UPI0035945A89